MRIGRRVGSAFVATLAERLQASADYCKHSILVRRFVSGEFGRICRWFLLNAPEYRSRLHRVWLWSEWPEAWGGDAGIDLVAEQHGGGPWAIQAKLYDRAYAIKKADVDSFLSESARFGCAYRLLIATTDRLGPTVRTTLDSQRQPVGYLLRSQLELAPVTWPASPADLRSRRPPRKTPLPHVRATVSARSTRPTSACSRY